MPNDKSRPTTPRSYTIDSELLIDARHVKGWSQKTLSKKVKLAPNTILNAEKGKPIAISTIRMLCDVLDLDFELIIKKDGCEISPLGNDKNEIASKEHEDVEVVFETFDGDTDPLEIVRRIQLLLSYLNEDQINIIKARLGSVHLTLKTSADAANSLRNLCDKNEHGELVIGEGLITTIISKVRGENEFLKWELDQERSKRKALESKYCIDEAINQELTARRANLNQLCKVNCISEESIALEEVGQLDSVQTKAQKMVASAISIRQNPEFTVRCQRVLQAAKQLFRGRPDWVTFFREVLGVNGAARSVFPNQAEYALFEQSLEFTDIQTMVASLRTKKANFGGKNEATRVITVRLPESLHEALKAEVAVHKTSMNKLCISKLLQALVEEENVVQTNAANRSSKNSIPNEISTKNAEPY